MPDISSGMAFVFDSLATLLLFASALIAWRLSRGARASSRINIRFAAMLFAALAAAQAIAIAAPRWQALAPAVALIAASLGTVALALGLFALLARPIPPLGGKPGFGFGAGGGPCRSSVRRACLCTGLPDSGRVPDHRGNAEWIFRRCRARFTHAAGGGGADLRRIGFDGWRDHHRRTFLRRRPHWHGAHLTASCPGLGSISAPGRHSPHRAAFRGPAGSGPAIGR